MLPILWSRPYRSAIRKVFPAVLKAISGLRRHLNPISRRSRANRPPEFSSAARRRQVADPCSPIPKRPSVTDPTKCEECAMKTSRQRLAEEKACLEHLEVERRRRREVGFGRITEARIIWGELLELELQDIDEQLNRICEADGRATGPASPTSK
jgi:hypothetical protein